MSSHNVTTTRLKIFILNFKILSRILTSIYLFFIRKIVGRASFSRHTKDRRDVFVGTVDETCAKLSCENSDTTSCAHVATSRRVKVERIKLAHTACREPVVGLTRRRDRRLRRRLRAQVLEVYDL